MNKSFLFVAAIIILLISSAAPVGIFVDPHTAVIKVQYNKSGYFQPNGSYYVVSIEINSPIQNLSLTYQQILFLSRINIPEINSNWSNIEFRYENGTNIYAWIQSYNTSSAVVWLKLSELKNRTVNLFVYPYSESFLNSTCYLGEAPQLSPLYAEYDNGANVFPFYTNYTTETSGKISIFSLYNTFCVDNGLDIRSNGNLSNVNSIVYYPKLTLPVTYQTLVTCFNGTSGFVFYISDSSNSNYNSQDILNGNISNNGVNSVGLWYVKTGDNFYQYNQLLLQPTTLNGSAHLPYTFANVSVIMPKYSIGPPSRGYAVKFVETGLSFGQDWSVSLDNTVESSRLSSIIFIVSNGSYNFSIRSLSGYTASQKTGEINVSGFNLIVPISFNKIIPFVFILDGIQPGLKWSVFINGTYYNSTFQYMVVNLINGTYNYSIILPSGYFAKSLNGKVNSTNTFVIVHAYPLYDVVITVICLAILISVVPSLYFLIIRKKTKIKKD